MAYAEASPLGWLHLSRPRENWHRLSPAEQDAMRDQFAGIRRATADDGAAVFGPYVTVGYGPWARFVYLEFPDLASLFRLEDRLQEIDYMSFVDFENHLGRKYGSSSGPDAPGEQPYCVVGFARHDDAWYSRPRSERERIELEEIGPSLEPYFVGGLADLALNICDITQGPQQYFLWEAPSLEVIDALRRHWDTFWRHHRGAQMIVGRKVDR